MRRTLLAAAAVLLAGCGGEAEPRNLLLISVDTLRPDLLGAYGYERSTSPAIDALAEEGVLFEDVMSPSPWTLPAHASLLTGVYPSRHGMKGHEARLPARLDTLASVLGDRGFRTAAVVNSHYVSAKYGLDRGFQDFHYVREAIGRVAPSEVGERARAWLRVRAAEPFFLFLHYYDVHSDYASLPRYERRFVRPYEGPANGTTGQLLRYREGEIELDPADARHLKDLYAAGIRQLDDGLARLRRTLEEEGLLERTLVVLTSDHGEEFLEHGGVLHGRKQHVESVRIPLVLRGPGLPEGRRIPTPASLVDVMPTLLSLLGVSSPPALDGRNLSPLFGDAPTEGLRGRFLFGEADHNNAEHDVTRAVRRGSFKLIYNRLSGRSELFDLAEDPGETRDVKAQQPEAARRLRAVLGRFLERETLPGEKAPALTPDERERLEALGYL